MNKKIFKTGDIVTPEFLNELQNLSYEKADNDVGRLPMPPNYDKKMQVFETENGAVDLSGATNRFVVVEHNGSTTSLQPVTIAINGVEDGDVKSILLITRGTDYPVTVSLPQTSDTRKNIVLKGGSSAILTEFSYGGTLVWKCYELEKNPVAMIDTGWKSFSPSGNFTSFVKFATLTVPKGYSAVVEVKGTGHSTYPVTSGTSGVVVDYTIQAIDANDNSESCRVSVLKCNDSGFFLPEMTQEYDARDDEFSGSLVIPPASNPSDRSFDLKIKTTKEAMNITASFRALLYKSELNTNLLV